MSEHEYVLPEYYFTVLREAYPPERSWHYHDTETCQCTRCKTERGELKCCECDVVLTHCTVLGVAEDMHVCRDCEQIAEERLHVDPENGITVPITLAEE